MKEILPIGSVVKLKDIIYKYIIVGKIVNVDGKKYDYVLCLYPFGHIIGVDFKYANNEDIEKVYFLGDINN